MRHYTEAQLEGVVGMDEAIDAMASAFIAWSDGRARVQQRIPTDLGDLRLNTMAAAMPGHCGAKVYTAFQSNFSFVTLLFSTADGRAVASFESEALTRLRTAAVSLLAARHLARPASTTLTIFGTGTQARNHALALAGRYPLERILVVGRGNAAAFAREIAAATGIDAIATSAHDALPRSDIVVTATRSRAPLFDGALLPEGCTVLAVGSARPDAAEIDATTVARSARIVVESIEAARHEAGDLIGACENGVDPFARLVELGELVAGRAAGRGSDADITLFESLGSALEDVAIASLAYRKLAGPHPH